MQVRHNSQEIHDFFSDLEKWYVIPTSWPFPYRQVKSHGMICIFMYFSFHVFLNKRTRTCRKKGQVRSRSYLMSVSLTNREDEMKHKDKAILKGDLNPTRNGRKSLPGAPPCMHACVCMCVYECIFVHACVHTCLFVCAYVCVSYYYTHIIIHNLCTCTADTSRRPSRVHCACVHVSLPMYISMYVIFHTWITKTKAHIPKYTSPEWTPACMYIYMPCGMHICIYMRV
jgi:hypothetical protein